MNPHREVLRLAMNGCRLFGVLAALVPLALTGCNPGLPTSEVRGKVTYKGEPIPVGMITFLAADDSGRADSALIKDGDYVLPHAPVGSVKIQVAGSNGALGSASPANAKRKLTKGQMKLAESMGAKLAEPLETQPKRPPFRVPAKYQDVSTSGLTYEVRSGAQTYNIDLLP